MAVSCLSQVAGVWYIMLIALGVSVLLTLLERVRRKFAARARPAASLGNSRSAQPQAANDAGDSDAGECFAEVGLPAAGKCTGEVACSAL